MIELFLVSSMRAFDFAIEPWCSWLDINMTNPLILNMPMELCLKLMTVVRPNGLNAKRKLLYNMIDEVDGILLIMPFVDF